MLDLNLLLLAIGVLICLFISMLFTKNDIVAPGCIVLLMALAHISSTIYCESVYRYEVRGQTIGVIILGLGGVFLSTLICNPLQLRNRRRAEIQVMDMSYTFQLISLFIGVITLLSVFQAERRLLNANGLGSAMLLVSVKNTRQLMFLGEELPLMPRMLIHILRCIMFVELYKLAYDIIEKRKGSFKKNILIIINFGVSALVSLIQSQRTDILFIIFTFVTMLMIMFQKKYGQLLKNRKTVFKIVIIMIAFVYAFTFSGALIGRKVRTLQGVPTVATYLGNNIIALDIFLKQNVHMKSFSETQTFARLYSNIFRYLFGQAPGVKDYQFISWNGISLGNTYTALKKYYFDFGYAGVIIIPFILGLIFNKAYKSISFVHRKRRYIKTHNIEQHRQMSLIFYSYLVAGFYLFLYDEHVLSTRLSFATLIDIAITYILLVIIKYSGKVKFVVHKKTSSITQSNSIR